MTLLVGGRRAPFIAGGAGVPHETPLERRGEAFKLLVVARATPEARPLGRLWWGKHIVEGAAAPAAERVTAVAWVISRATPEARPLGRVWYGRRVVETPVQRVQRYGPLVAARPVPEARPLGRVQVIARPLFTTDLATAQKTLGGIPSLFLSIGGHELGEYIVAYIYEESAHRAGGLTLWLENRNDRFDDLATDYPGLTHGAAVDFRRGLVIDGTAMREKLPTTWLESISWSEGGQMILTCVDWLGLLERFYYSSTTTFSSQAHSAIASSILGQVGLTLAAGSFGYSTDFEVGRFESGREALQRLMNLCHEKLYTGTGGEIQFKRLDSTEAAGYSYDFSTGGGSNHPLLPGTEVWTAAAPFNTIVVTGAIDESFSGSATSAAQVALVGTRRINIRVVELASNAQCTEVAESWLDEFLSHLNGGVILARPHFTVRLYDVLSIAAAPPWGGPTSTGRVRQIFERFNRVNGRWEQELVLGDVPFQALAQRARIGEIK